MQLIFEPLDFIARAAALIPAPKTHFIHYHGVFAPASPLRPVIVRTLDEEEDKKAVEQLVDVHAMTMGHKRPASQPAAAPLAPRALPSPPPSKASPRQRLIWDSYDQSP